MSNIFDFLAKDAKLSFKEMRRPWVDILSGSTSADSLSSRWTLLRKFMSNSPTGAKTTLHDSLHAGLAVIDRLRERLSSGPDANLEDAQRHIRTNHTVSIRISYKEDHICHSGFSNMLPNFWGLEGSG